MFGPCGCTVPSRKISLISCCFRWVLVPLHKCIPRTWTSVILWPVELKCWATGNRGVFLRMLRKCSPNRLIRLRPVSPIQRREHRRQDMPHTRFSDIHVKCSRMVTVHLGPVISVRGCVYSQVLPSPFNHSKLHMAVYGLSLHQGSTESRKTPEQKFIFQIGTLNPLGINERFSTNLFCCFSRYHAPTNSVAASFCM